MKAKKKVKPINSGPGGIAGIPRPEVRHVQGAPYKFERDFDRSHLSITYNEKFGGLYIGQSKYAKGRSVQADGKNEWRSTKKKDSEAFIVLHERGLLLMEAYHGGWNRTIIPGEIGLTRTVNILAKNTIPMKKVNILGNDSNSILKEYSEEENYKSLAFENINDDLESIKIESAIKTRKTEIAIALLHNKIWKSRGFSDPKNKIPNESWRWSFKYYIAAF